MVTKKPDSSKKSTVQKKEMKPVGGELNTHSRSQESEKINPLKKTTGKKIIISHEEDERSLPEIDETYLSDHAEDKDFLSKPSLLKRKKSSGIKSDVNREFMEKPSDLEEISKKIIDLLPDEVKIFLEHALRDGYVLQDTLAKIEDKLSQEEIDFILGYLVECDINIIKNDELDEKIDGIEDIGEDHTDEEAEEVEEDDLNESTKIDKSEDLTGISTINLYLKDVAKFDLLSKDEEQELSKQIRGGKDELLRVLSYFSFLKKYLQECKSKLSSGQITIRNFVDTYSIADHELEEKDIEENIRSDNKNLDQEKIMETTFLGINNIIIFFDEMENHFHDLMKRAITYSQYKSKISKAAKGAYNELKSIRISNQFIDEIVEIISSRSEEIKKDIEGLAPGVLTDILKKNPQELSDKDIDSMVQIMGNSDNQSPEGKIFRTQYILKSLIPHFLDFSQELSSLHYKNNEAYKRMVGANIRLVVAVAKKYLIKGGGRVQFLDLIQEGILGLTKAVARFSYLKKCKFSTYAHWWMRQSILRAIADKRSSIRLPVHAMETINKINRAYKELQNKLVRKPSKWEVAELCNISIDKVNRSSAWSRRVSSMSDMVSVSSDNEKKTAEERIEDKNSPGQEKIFLDRILKIEINDILAEASPRDERIMRIRHLTDKVKEQTDITLSELHDFTHKIIELFNLYSLNTGIDVIYDGTFESKMVIDRLGEKLKNQMIIIELYFIINPLKRTLEEVGKYYQVTRERCRQLEDQQTKSIFEKHGARIRKYAYTN